MNNAYDEVIFKALSRWLKSSHCKDYHMCEMDMQDHGSYRLSYTCPCYKKILNEEISAYDKVLESLYTDGHLDPDKILEAIKRRCSDGRLSDFVVRLFNEFKKTSSYNKFIEEYRKANE